MNRFGTSIPDRIVFFLFTLSSPCDDITRLVSDRRERRLTFREWADMTYHLFICSLCRRYAGQLSVIARLLRSGATAPTAVLSPEEKSRMAEAVARRLDGR